MLKLLNRVMNNYFRTKKEIFFALAILLIGSLLLSTISSLLRHHHLIEYGWFNIARAVVFSSTVLLPFSMPTGFAQTIGVLSENFLRTMIMVAYWPLIIFLTYKLFRTRRALFFYLICVMLIITSINWLEPALAVASF